MLVVDTAMVGRLGNSALASMMIAGPATFLIITVFDALGVATVATVARATGERDDAKRVGDAAASMAVALVAGTIVGVLSWFLLPGLAGLYRIPGEEGATIAARGYLKAFVPCIPFVLLEISATAAMRAAGNTRAPMVLAILGNLVNVAGNYALIYGNWGAPAMGVRGAGLATCISLVVQGLLSTALLVSPWSPLRVGWGDLRRVSRDALARLWRVLGPALVEPLLLRTGFLVFIKWISLLGETATAAHRAAITVESLSFMPGYGFSVACSALVGQYLGAREPGRAAAAIRESTKLAVIFMSLVGVVFLAIPGVLVAPFLADPGAAGAAATCLRIATLAAAMVLRGALRGAGDTRNSLLVGAVCIWGIRVPAAYLLAFPLGLGLNGIWLTMVLDWTAQMAWFGWIVRRGRWKSLKL